MATTKKANVVGLAKSGSKTTAKKPAARKTTTSKAKTENKTATEKAKEKVEELLSDVNLEKKKKEDLLELVDETPEKAKGAEWLEEQVEKLTVANEALTKENQALRTSSNEAAIIGLFNEFQTEYLKHPPQTMAYTQIYLTALMGKMLGAFPFLQKHKRY